MKRVSIDMADKNERDDRIVSIEDDYIELLSSVEADDKFEDVYSSSSEDIYIGRKRYVSQENEYEDEDEGGVYISRKRHSGSRYGDFVDVYSKTPTEEIPVEKRTPPVKKKITVTMLDEDEVSDYDARHKKSRKKKSPVGAILVILLAFIVGFVGLVGITAGGIVGKFQKAEDIEHIENVGALRTEPYVKNILLIGTDKKTGDSSRSDSIMIASVNSKTNKVTIVSVLRDTHLYIPGEREAKVNAAYSWGGANLLIQTIEYNFGIKIDDYATVDFDMFQALVDGVGGIYVDVSEAEADHLNSYFKLGTDGKPEKVESGENVYLDGFHALCYARIRKLDSDFNRTERQRKIISAIAENVKADLNPAGVFKLLDTAENVAPYIETTLTQTDFWSLVMTLGGAFLSTGGDIDSLLVNAKIPFDDSWWYSSQWDGSSISIDLEENKKQLHDLIFAQSVEELPETSEDNQ